jgi:serine phosphatase RsbU (regulator of sigma subunit)
MRRGPIAIAAGCALGLALTALWFPRFDITTERWKPRLSRANAVQLAIQLAAENGADVSPWNFAVETHEVPGMNRAWRFASQSPVLRPFSPIEIRVLAHSPNGVESVLVTLSPQGRPLGYLDRRTLPGRASDSPHHAELAQRQLARYAGAMAHEFQPTAAAIRSQEGLRSVWQRTDPTTPGILSRLEVVTAQDRVVRVAYRWEIADDLQAPLRDARRVSSMLYGLIVVLAVAICTILATVLTFLRLTRRSDHTDFGLAFSAYTALPVLVGLLSGAAYDAAVLAAFDSGGSITSRLMLGFFFSLLAMLTLFVLITAGFAMLPVYERPRWVGVRLLTQWRIFTRPVGREVALGLLGGAGITAAPYLAAALLNSTNAPANLLEPDFLTQRFPGLASIQGLLRGWEVFSLFAFVLPVCLHFIRRRWLCHAIVVLSGILFAASYRQPIPDSVPANLLASAFIVAASYGVYRATGILGIWVLPMGWWAGVHSATLFATGVPHLVMSGWQAALVQVAVFLGAAAVWAFGPSVDQAAVEDSMEPGERSLTRSERDRLQADFSVARRAQMGMLPTAPPVIPGFTIAASCEPALEVGGDLFDFLEFPGGQLGLCVADVSGKGVPAALYMTLTKGMLTSAQLRPPDLEVIASRLNRFLAETGKRRTFVTMSLGLLDARQRRFRHFRAGHNPPLLFRAATRACQFLQPSGLGLGITAGRAFERNLQVDEVQLEPGDVLVLYSDGLTECMNPLNEEFGEDRLQDVVSRFAHRNALGIEHEILREARQFRGAADPHDDLTVMVLRAESTTAGASD